MIITVGNTKGGVGKTTIALNLAIARALQGRDVWLIDGDRQGTAQTAITTAPRTASNRRSAARTTRTARRCAPRSFRPAQSFKTSSSTPVAVTRRHCAPR